MSGRRLPRVLMVCALWLLLAGQASAQLPKLVLRTSPSVPILRSGAPSTVEVNLVYQSPELLEGKLELDFRRGSELLVRYRSDELALAGGSQAFRIMMPAMTVPQPDQWISIFGRFITEEGSIEFPEQTLNVAAEWKRSFVIAVCRKRRGVKDINHNESLRFGNTRLANYLQLDKYQPHNSSRSEMATLVTDISPEMFPSTAVGYFSYDMLFLADRGFDTLRGKQLDAIVSWVKAGGSLGVMAHSSMSSEQVDFLNTLLDTDATAPAFTRADDGRTSAVGYTDETILVKHRSDLGRVLLILKPVEPKEFAKTKQWKDATAFLWKVRQEQIPFFVEQDRWNWETKNDKERDRLIQLRQQVGGRAVNQRIRRFPDEIRPLAPRRMEQAYLVEQLLMPKEVSGLPFPLVLSILTVFLLAVGPLDYYVLGFFRKRKYTWVLFATVSLTCTGVTVVVAQRYMGDQDYRRGLVIHDIGNDGRRVRKTRIELLFTATSKQLATDMRNMTFTPADRYLKPNDDFNQYPRGGALPTDDEDVAIHTGKVPSTFTIQQSMRQWSPTISRTTSLDDADFKSPFNFANVTVESTVTKADREKTAAQIVSAFGEETEVYWRIKPKPKVNRDMDSTLSFREPPKKLDLLFFAINLSDRKPAGLFNILSQISPTGESLEDLAVLDNSDHEQRLMIVMTKRGEDVVFYRKLLAG